MCFLIEVTFHLEDDRRLHPEAERVGVLVEAEVSLGVQEVAPLSGLGPGELAEPQIQVLVTCGGPGRDIAALNLTQIWPGTQHQRLPSR